MKQGAWINSRTGAWSWITEHAAWITAPTNARSLGVPEPVIAELAVMPRDFNGPKRKAILLKAMGQGFIRLRGHGVDWTFEHTLPQEAAIRTCLALFGPSMGPLTLCRFSRLETGETAEFPYRDAARWQPRRPAPTHDTPR